jgi:hypothetical protein
MAASDSVRHLDHRIDHLGQERRLHPWPANSFDPRTVQTQAGVAALVVIEKHRALGIGTQHAGAVLAITHVAPRVAVVPPVPGLEISQLGSGCCSKRICWKIDSAMLLFARQSVARSA